MAGKALETRGELALDYGALFDCAKGLIRQVELWDEVRAGAGL